MKKQNLLLAFLLTNAVFAVAQVTFEKTYDGVFINRYKMPINGELYFAKMTTNAPVFNIYDSNHTVKSQIPLLGNLLRKKSVLDISESPNGSLRFLTSVYDSLGLKTESVNLNDENGQRLITLLNYPYPDSLVNMSFLKTNGI